jgi:hypothetical protein
VEQLLLLEVRLLIYFLNLLFRAGLEAEVEVERQTAISVVLEAQVSLVQVAVVVEVNIILVTGQVPVEQADQVSVLL